MRKHCFLRLVLYNRFRRLLLLHAILLIIISNPDQVQGQISSGEELTEDQNQATKPLEVRGVPFEFVRIPA